MREEIVAPILFFRGCDDVVDAIARQNEVPQGLSSFKFALDMREAEAVPPAEGSDCGIGNVNIDLPDVEMGGAFGGAGSPVRHLGRSDDRPDYSAGK